MSKTKEMKTSELLDELHTESIKEEIDDKIMEELEEEIDKRLPFSCIENRIEGSEGEEGLRDQIEALEKQIKELTTQFKDHDHKDNGVVIKL